MEEEDFFSIIGYESLDGDGKIELHESFPPYLQIIGVMDDMFYVWWNILFFVLWEAIWYP